MLKTSEVNVLNDKNYQKFAANIDKLEKTASEMIRTADRQLSEMIKKCVAAGMDWNEADRELQKVLPLYYRIASIKLRGGD